MYQDEKEEMQEFARLLFKGKTPFEAANLMHPNNINRACFIAIEWPKDARFNAIKDTLKGDTGDSHLMDRTGLLEVVSDRLQGTRYDNGQVIPLTPDEFVKVAKLFAEIRGYIEKPGVSINNNVVMPRVMAVPSQGNDAEWEAALANQQQQLLDVSRTRH